MRTWERVSKGVCVSANVSLPDKNRWGKVKEWFNGKTGGEGETVSGGLGLTVERLTTLPESELEKPYAHSRDCVDGGWGGGVSGSVVAFGAGALCAKKQAKLGII